MSLITPIAKFMAMYNADRQNNGLQELNINDFDLIDPKPYSGPRSTENTVLYLQAKPASPVIGLATVYYNRDNLNKAVIRVNKGSASTLAELLPELNKELGLAFEEKDFQPVSIPSSGTFTLTASPTNLFFTGATEVTLDT